MPYRQTGDSAGCAGHVLPWQATGDRSAPCHHFDHDHGRPADFYSFCDPHHLLDDILARVSDSEVYHVISGLPDQYAVQLLHLLGRDPQDGISAFVASKLRYHLQSVSEPRLRISGAVLLSGPVAEVTYNTQGLGAEPLALLVGRDPRDALSVLARWPVLDEDISAAGILPLSIRQLGLAAAYAAGAPLGVLALGWLLAESGNLPELLVTAIRAAWRQAVHRSPTLPADPLPIPQCSGEARRAHLAYRGRAEEHPRRQTAAAEGQPPRAGTLGHSDAADEAPAGGQRGPELPWPTRATQHVTSEQVGRAEQTSRAERTGRAEQEETPGVVSRFSHRLSRRSQQEAHEPEPAEAGPGGSVQELLPGAARSVRAVPSGEIPASRETPEGFPLRRDRAFDSDSGPEETSDDSELGADIGLDGAPRQRPAAERPAPDDEGTTPMPAVGPQDTPETLRERMRQRSRPVVPSNPRDWLGSPRSDPSAAGSMQDAPGRDDGAERDLRRDGTADAGPADVPSTDALPADEPSARQRSDGAGTSPGSDAEADASSGGEDAGAVEAPAVRLHTGGEPTGRHASPTGTDAVDEAAPRLEADTGTGTDPAALAAAVDGLSARIPAARDALSRAYAALNVEQAPDAADVTELAAVADTFTLLSKQLTGATGTPVPASIAEFRAALDELQRRRERDRVVGVLDRLQVLTGPEALADDIAWVRALAGQTADALRSANGHPVAGGAERSSGSADRGAADRAADQPSILDGLVALAELVTLVQGTTSGGGAARTDVTDPRIAPASTFHRLIELEDTVRAALSDSVRPVLAAAVVGGLHLPDAPEAG